MGDVMLAFYFAASFSFAVLCAREAIRAYPWRSGSARIEGARWGDCSDEMFEAMREVDAMGLSGEPLLQAGLPPRSVEEELHLKTLRTMDNVNRRFLIQKVCEQHGATYCEAQDVLVFPDGSRVGAELLVDGHWFVQ